VSGSVAKGRDLYARSRHSAATVPTADLDPARPHDRGILTSRAHRGDLDAKARLAETPEPVIDDEGEGDTE